MKLKALVYYKDEWVEEVEVEVPDGATWREAEELRSQVVGRHLPSPPPASRISPVNMTHVCWDGDPEFGKE